MICCTMSIPEAIGKSDEITQSMISESHRKSIVTVGTIERITMVRSQRFE